MAPVRPRAVSFLLKNHDTQKQIHSVPVYNKPDRAWFAIACKAFSALFFYLALTAELLEIFKRKGLASCETWIIFSLVNMHCPLVIKYIFGVLSMFCSYFHFL